jgi:SAM-dependent methyltransferase
MTSVKPACQLCKKCDRSILFRLKDFNIVRCNTCGLVFRNIYLDSESAKELYSKDYFTNEQADYFFNNPKEKEDLFRKRLHTVESRVSKKGRLLDIGCAIGTFLKIARDGGWDARGCEISEFASRYARDEYKLDVICGEFDKAKFAGDEKFDVITMWDVVDHSEDPVAFLSDAADLLKPGGCMFVQTTMEDSLVYEVCKYVYKLSFGLIGGPAAKGHPIHHSTFFSRTTLRKALESCGLRVEGMEMSEYPARFFPGGKLSRQVFGLFYLLGNIVNRPLVVTFAARKVDR